MSGGGSGGGATTQNVTQTNIPAYARPYFERMMKRGEAVSNQPYQAYGGQRIATADPDTTASYNMAENLGGTYNQNFQNASGLYGGAAGTALNAYHSFDPNAVGQFDSQAATNYMNPYTQNVITQAQKNINAQYDEGQAQRNFQAANSGAFGGSRSAVANEVARRSYDNTLATTTADLLNKGYTNAQAAFMADRDAKLKAQEFSGQLGIQAADTALRSGAAYQGLGESAFKLGGQQSQLMNQYGEQKRQLTQSELDKAYNDFVNQRDYTRGNVGYLSQLLRGLPISGTSDVTASTPSQSPLNQALGLGIAGLGAYRSANAIT